MIHTRLIPLTKLLSILLFACGFLSVPVPVQARQNEKESSPLTLKAGDPAPPFAPGQWLKGEPVAKLEKGQVYVVEFWATWCGPCMQSIPHLTKLQQQFKDVIFIGQNCLEQDQTAVPAAVKALGDRMNYRVVLDDMKKNPDGVMVSTWLNAAGQDGIPCAFVVNKDTKIAWIGHPLELDRILPAVLDGSFDPAKETTRKELREKFEKAVENSDFDQALILVEQLPKGNAEEIKEYDLQKYALLVGKKDFPASLKMVRELAKKYADDAVALNEMAWSLVDPGNPFDHPDLGLAEEIINHANTLTKSREPDVLDTLARVYFMQGKFDLALQTESDAFAKAAPNQQQQLQATLDQYRAAAKNPATPATSDAKPTPAPEAAPTPSPGASATAVEISNPVVWDDDGILDQIEKESTEWIKADKITTGKQLLHELRSVSDHCALSISADKLSDTPKAHFYDTCRSGVLIVAGIYKCKNCHKYEAGTAAGFVISTDGLAVTNYHVVDVPDNVALVAMTSDRRLIPVRSVLAASKKYDIAILQLDGEKFTALPLTTAEPVGGEIYVLSHPDERFFSLTRGMVSRYSLENHFEKEDPVPVMEITADFAKGASGGPILNAAGQVVGMVCSTSSVYYDDDKERDLQMVFKECVPSEQILAMLAGDKMAVAHGL